jgi:hypothetical protein
MKNPQLTGGAIVLLNALAALKAGEISGVEQPQAEYTVAPQKRRTTPTQVRGQEFAVKAVGQKVKDEFSGVLTVGALRPKRNGDGQTHDCTLAKGKKIVAQFTLSENAVSRLQERGTRVFVEERCYLVTLS